MPRELRAPNKPLRIVIADDPKLSFSDDYRDGWRWGFHRLGCEVRFVDVSPFRQSMARPGTRMVSMSRHGAGIAKMVAQQVINQKPDLVFAHHGRAASGGHFLDMLKSHGIRSAVYLCDEPYESGETATYSPRYDFVFSMDPMTVEAHRLSRPNRDNVFYLLPGVNTEHFKYRPYFDDNGELCRDIRAFFLGNGLLIPRQRWFKPVLQMVEGADIRYMKTVWKNRHKEWIPFDQHPKWYGRCQVGLNVHRHPAITKECCLGPGRFEVRNRGKPVPAGIQLCRKMPPQEGTGFWNDGNLPAAHISPRFFEMAACGTLVVSDASRDEMRRLFPCAPIARDPDEYLTLVLYYLENLEEAEEIGRICSYLISRRHSYAHRAAEVLIRVGLKDSIPENVLSSLGLLEDWLSPQDLGQLKESWSSAQIGRSEPWSPASGLSWISTFGSPSAASSTDAPPPWLL